MTEATPRVSRSMLQNYVDHTVRIIGRADDMNQDILTLTTSDGGSVQVQVNRGAPSNINYQGFIEVVGKVNPNLSIREHVSYVWAPNQNDFGMYFSLRCVSYHLHLSYCGVCYFVIYRSNLFL
jgi:hypothetical protein